MATPHVPAELIMRIIAFLISSHNINEAWKLRGVSKTFQALIDYEIFARQPVSAFLRTKEKSARTILKNNLGLHLAYRACINMDRLLGAHDFLPKFLKNRLDWLNSIGVMKEGRRNEFAHLLGNQLAYCYKPAYNLVTQKSTAAACRQVIPDFDIHAGNCAVEEIATAAAVGDLETVKNLAALYGYKFLWDLSSFFGHPLVAAAGGSHTELVHFLLANFKDHYRKHPNKEYHTAFVNAIDVSLTRRHSAMSHFLLASYNQYFAVPDLFHAQWLTKATLNPDHRVFDAVDAVRTNSHVRKHIIPFELVCKGNSVAKLQLFFASGRLDINQGYHENKSFRCLLYIAVGAGNIDVVLALLQMGAHPDGPPLCAPWDRPLWQALAHNSIDIFDLLLLQGADRRPILHYWNFTSDEFKRQHFEVGQYLRNGAALYWIYNLGLISSDGA